MKNLDKFKSAYLFTDRVLRRYFTGVDIAEGVLVVEKEKTYFTDSRYFLPAKEKLKEKNIECKLYKGLDSVFDHLKSLGVNQIFIDYNTTTVREYENYKEKGVLVSDCAKDIAKLRSVKREDEIDSIVRACKITERAYYEAVKTVRLGMSEIELKETLEKLMLSFGAESIAFETIVAFGENSAVPHHETGDTMLCDNMPILVDMGCTVNGYCSDLTRTAFFGKPDEEFVKVYELVKNANILAEEKIVNGMSFFDADKIARDYLEENGYGEFFTHSLGHGVGLEIHEYPTLSKRGDGVVQENMVFTIEPGVYLDYKFGVRIEDSVLIKGGKVQRLYKDDKKLLIL